MKGLVVVLAVLAGAVGAGLWGLVAWVTGYSLGILAIGIGVLVGAPFIALKSHGPAQALVAAVIALAAVMGGNILQIELSLGQSAELRETIAAEAPTTEMHYEFFLSEVEDFAELESPSDAELQAFLEANGYQISVEQFNEVYAPALRDAATKIPTYEEWKEAEIDRSVSLTASMIREDLSYYDVLVENGDPMDLVFYLIAVAVAFGAAFKEGDGVEDQGNQAARVRPPIKRASNQPGVAREPGALPSQAMDGAAGNGPDHSSESAADPGGDDSALEELTHKYAEVWQHAGLQRFVCLESMRKREGI